MKKVYLLALVAAVLFGALMFLYLQGSSNASAEPEETRKVVVALQDIAAETPITEEMLGEKEVPVSSVQVNALSSKEDAVGKCCASQIVKGEQVLSHMLSESGATGVRLSDQLRGNERGMTIEVETDAGVGGYVQAGDYIDLLGVILDENDEVVRTYQVVQNVKVARVNEATKEGQTPYSYFTLIMSEDQCAAVYAYQAEIPSGSTAAYHAILRPSGGAS